MNKIWDKFDEVLNGKDAVSVNKKSDAKTNPHDKNNPLLAVHTSSSQLRDINFSEEPTGQRKDEKEK